MEKKKVLIMGAGVAGLSAAVELLRQSKDYLPIVIEAEESVGGIARTLKYKGNCMDLGGHRFFSKDEKIMDWWQAFMPLQGSASKEDKKLKIAKPLLEGGPDPETEDKVMLIRHRVSRILYLRRFFDYPISLKAQTFINMGFVRTVRGGFGYIGARLKKRKEDSLEDFMINRFGKPLYNMFFEDYTQKVWGRHPSMIDASWGTQRIKGLSLFKAILNAIKTPFSKGKEDLLQSDKETSLIDRFMYPKYGPGQLWEQVADEVKKLGGEIRLNTKVVGLQTKDNKVISVTLEGKEGNQETLEASYVMSSIAIKDLIEALDVKEPAVNDIAQALPYRDFITVGVLVNKLKIKNQTKIKTINHLIPDTWIYIQDREVKVGRIQIFNNWSPYLVKDYLNTVWIGLEYFCEEGDSLWSMNEKDLISLAKEELVRLQLVEAEDIIDVVRYKIKKAYPAYFGSYKSFDKVRGYLDSFENLYCIGRNGQHRYNNMDHSMITAFEAVKNILRGIKDKSNIWAVNAEESYHEVKE